MFRRRGFFRVALAAVLVLGLVGITGGALYRLGYAQGTQEVTTRIAAESSTDSDTDAEAVMPFGPRYRPYAPYGYGYGFGFFPFWGFGLFFKLGFFLLFFFLLTGVFKMFFFRGWYGKHWHGRRPPWARDDEGTDDTEGAVA